MLLCYTHISFFTLQIPFVYIFIGQLNVNSLRNLDIPGASLLVQILVLVHKRSANSCQPMGSYVV